MEWLWLLSFFFLGVGAFIVSTLSAGGGALVLVPVVNALIGVEYTAAVVNFGVFLGRPARFFLFWKFIQWKVCLYYAIPAILGALLAVRLLGSFRLEFLQLLVALFLISTLFQYRFGKKSRSFTMKLVYFIPLGLGVSFLSTLIGAMGPVLNPFYLNLGLDKEEMIATKTANSFLMGITQIGGYTFFSLLIYPYWLYGLSLGLGAIVGTVLARNFLSGMKSVTFRRWVIAMMVLSGVLMLYGVLKPWLTSSS
jgi:hypothetical protein